MASVLERFLVQIDVDSEIEELIAFNNRLNALDRTFTQVGFAARSMALNLGLMAGAMASGEIIMGGVATAGAGLTAVVSHLVTQTARQARTTEVALDRLQKMRLGLQTFNIKAEKAVDVFSSLSEAQQGAVAGTKSDVEAFQKLGLSVQEVQGLEPWQLFQRVADAAKNSNDQVRAATGVQDIFGKALGSKIMPMLEQGSGGIAAMGKNMEELGAILDEKTVVKFEELNKNGMQLWIVLRGMARTLAKFLMPHLLDLSNRILKSFRNNVEDVKDQLREWARFMIHALQETERTFFQVKSATNEMGGVTNILEDLKDVIGTLVAFQLGGYFLSIAGTVGSAATSLVGFFKAVAAGEASLVSLIGGASGASSVTFPQFAAAILAIAGAVTTLVLVFEDIWTYLEGGKSVIGSIERLITESDAFQNAWDQLTKTVNALKADLSDLWKEIDGPVATALQILVVIVGSILINTLFGLILTVDLLINSILFLVDGLQLLVDSFMAAVSAAMLFDKALEALTNPTKIPEVISQFKDLKSHISESRKEARQARKDLGRLTGGIIEIGGAAIQGGKGFTKMVEGPGSKKPRPGGISTRRRQSMLPSARGGRSGGQTVINQQNQMNVEAKKADEETIRDVGREMMAKATRRASKAASNEK